MKNTFISYMRDDHDVVNKLQKDLAAKGIPCWLDTTHLPAGQEWEKQIQTELDQCGVFLACFSGNWGNRWSYMEHELSIALERFKLITNEKLMVIPVKLGQCEIPRIPIGDKKLITDLMWIDLTSEYEEGIEWLTRTIIDHLQPQQYWMKILHRNLEHYVLNRIKDAQEIEIPLYGEAVELWMGMLEINSLKALSKTFYELILQSKSRSAPIHSQIVFPDKIVILSVMHSLDLREFEAALPVKRDETKHRYLDFILEQYVKFRALPSWQSRAFVHAMYFWDAGDETLFDMLYIYPHELDIKMLSHQIQINKSKRGDKFAYHVARMVPTSFMGAFESELLHSKILKDSARIDDTYN